MIPLRDRLRLVAVLSLLACRPSVAGEIDPIGTGPYPVATTNLEVNAPADVPMIDFLNGKRTGAKATYLTDILVHPEAVPTVQVTAPSNPAVFGPDAGKPIPTLIVVVYPTTKENTRADYSFPYKETGDRVFSHMQRPGEAPLLPPTPTRFPLIVLSGGFNTHPLWHLEHLKLLASHGYIVADVVHADSRFPHPHGANALRVLELDAALDWLLGPSAFAARIDPERIGAAGQSAGGHTILAAMGGIDAQGRIPAVKKVRIKAGFGLVPFLGATFGTPPFALDAWYFGQDHAGLRGVRGAFFAVYGEKDKNVPPAGVEQGVRQVAGPAAAVMLDNEKHGLTAPAHSDAYTWELLFFDAWVRDDPAARQRLATADSVRGGVHDHVTFRRLSR